jgi:hypothetical protein
MSRTSSVWNILLLGMLAQLSLAQAQQTPSSAPPKLERIEAGADTPIVVTPGQKSGKTIVEKRDGGRTTEVQVTTGKSSYTMKANAPDAIGQGGDAAGSALRPPQWKVLEFDLFKKKQKKELDEAAAAAMADAPPPPPLPATTK